MDIRQLGASRHSDSVGRDDLGNATDQVLYKYDDRGNLTFAIPKLTRARRSM